jgi:hypothetical protein
MSTLYVTELTMFTAEPGLPSMPPLAEQTVAIGSTSAQSAPFGASTTRVRLTADVSCSVAWGADPTATASNMLLAANTPYDFQVYPGLVVAVIANT